jgi:hypothetical protein
MKSSPSLAYITQRERETKKEEAFPYLNLAMKFVSR